MALFGQGSPQIGGGWGAVGDLLSGGLQRVDAAAAADQMQLNRREATGKLGWEKALEEAQMTRAARIARDGLPQAVQALGLDPALGQVLLAADGGNVAQYADALGGLQSFAAGSNARQAALTGGWDPVNAELVARANGPLELTKVQGDTYINPLAMPEQQSNDMTPLGDARIAKLGAEARVAGSGGGTGGGAGLGKPPSGYQWVAGGGLEPIPGGPADRSRAPNQFGRPGAAGGLPRLTEGQSKDLVYWRRGSEANDLLSGEGGALGLDVNLTPTGGSQGLRGIADEAIRSLPFVGDSMAANYAVSEGRQKAEQAAREFLSAILRKDTGAAITNQEMEIYGKTYLPQAGDSAGVLAQKAEARRIALQGIEAGMGPLLDPFRAKFDEQDRARQQQMAPAAIGAAAPLPSPVGRPLRYNPATGELE